PPILNPYRLTDLSVTADYRLKRVDDMYADDGLGVPLIGHRPNDRERPAEPNDRYFPYQMHVAATAVLRPAGTPADWRQDPATLTPFDPFEVRAVAVGGRAVRLATDRTTPLAEQETESNLEVFRRIGVLRPDAIRPEVGLYMPQPYRPGKIPVVLVHGFFASPSIWAKPVNRLQNDPELA